MKREAAFLAARRAGAAFADTRQGCMALKDVARVIKKRGVLPGGAADFIFQRANKFDRSFFGIVGTIQVYDRRNRLLVTVDLRKHCPKP